MPEVVVLVHTVPPLVSRFADLCRTMLPDVRVLHVLDEPLLERIRDRGGSGPEDEERLADHVRIAETVGASAVLVTCSTVSLCVDAIQPRFALPIVKIDGAMAAEAVRIGGRITILATNPTTMEPSRRLIEEQARRTGRGVTIRLRHVEGALAALLEGNAAEHDRLVAAAVHEAAPRAAVVVLAQASMARVLGVLAGAPVAIPVLASPDLAVAEVRDILREREARMESAVGASEAVP